MLKINRQALIHKRPQSVRRLYDQYAAMLLGYIFEIVKDQKLAEEYLVQLFCDLTLHFDELNWTGTNNWCQLQRFARGHLKAILDPDLYNEASTISGLVMRSPRKQYLEQLTEEQKWVFYGVYYHGKSIIDISDELGKTEESIRKTFKEAFVIMKKGG